MSRRTPPAAYDLISIPLLRLTLGADHPARDVRWIRGDAATVLEIGAGGGFYTAHLAAHLADDATLIAIDPDQDAVDDLNGRARGRFTAVRAAGEALPLEDHSVDAILYSYSLEQFDHPERGIAEALRVLRPGGQLVAFLWRANLRGSLRALRCPGLQHLHLHHARRGIQNIRLDYRLPPHTSDSSGVSPG